MRLVDCHCHLDSDKFAEDREAVIQRNKERVDFVINSGVDLRSNAASIELAQEHEGFVYATLGLSPVFAGKMGDAEFKAVVGRVRDHADTIVGVGEVGLDYYWEKDPRRRERQQEVFKEFISLAKELRKPLVIHCRDADHDLWPIVEKDPPGTVVFHHFSAPEDFVPRLVDSGFYASLSTIACFSKRHARLIKHLPLEYTLTETDSPYNSPVRGERNEPFHVADLITLISSISGLDADHVSDAVHKNALRVFSVRR
jgi:TatD DNase family protein